MRGSQRKKDPCPRLYSSSSEFMKAGRLLSFRILLSSSGLIGLPLAAQTPQSSSENDIIVTAAPSAEQQLIDRKVYLVKNNAEAQTESGLDVLRHVPSVTVTAKQVVQLLGDPSVKVMIDGHPVSGGANALGSLPAARIAKIEVATNPSAAYSAEGTGGVINIVTRRDAAAGLAGSASAAVGSYGATEAKLSPSYSASVWSASLALDLRHDLNEFGGSRDRIASDSSLDFNQVKRDDFDITSFTSRIDLSYTPRPTIKWTLSLQHDDMTAAFDYQLISLARGSDQIPISEDNPNTHRYRHDVATLGYNWTGMRQSESLNVSANYDGPHDDWPGSVIDRFDGGIQQSEIIRSGFTRTSELKIDYVHPVRKADTFSIGGALTHARDSQTNGFLASGVLSAVPASVPTRATGDWTTIAAYGTFQFPIGGWKVLPGLRAEQRIEDVGSLDSSSNRNKLLLFPSLHIDRKLAKRLEFALSYSRRVQWPTITQLDPSLRYMDLLNAENGNPRLQPQLTNAFETSLGFTPGKQSLALKLFDRETSDAFATGATLNADGVSISTTNNAGSIRRLGGEFAISGPIWKGWRYSAATTLIARRSDIVEEGAFRPYNAFTYSGNFQLEYQDKPDGKPRANHFALEAQYSGPTRQYQQRVGSYFDSTFRWSHSYTKRISSVVKVSDLFLGDRDYTTLYGADYTQFDRGRENVQRVTISIVSLLGRTK